MHLEPEASTTRGPPKARPRPPPWAPLALLLAACSRTADPPHAAPIIADSALVPATTTATTTTASPGAARNPAPGVASGAPEPAIGPAIGPAVGPAVPSAAKVAEMLQQLKKLHDGLEKDPLTADNVSILIGTAEDSGQPAPRTFRPLAPGIEKARIGRFGSTARTGQIYLVTVNLLPDARPTIAELRSIFGPEHSGGLSLHGEREAMYYPPSTSQGWKAAVIASLSRCWDPHSPADPPTGPCGKLHAGSRVEEITFRRDGP